MLELFYQSVVDGAIFFAVVCWGSSIRVSDSNRLDKIIKKAGSVLGLKLEPLEIVVKRMLLNKMLSIMDNDQHPLHHSLDSGAVSPTGCYSSTVEGKDTGSLSCYRPSHCIIKSRCNFGFNWHSLCALFLSSHAHTLIALVIFYFVHDFSFYFIISYFLLCRVHSLLLLHCNFPVLDHKVCLSCWVKAQCETDICSKALKQQPIHSNCIYAENVYISLPHTLEHLHEQHFIVIFWYIIQWNCPITVAFWVFLQTQVTLRFV